MVFEHSGVLVDTDPATGTYCATYHYPSQPPSTTIALALMEITESGVTDLPPLYETASVSLDALDALFDPTTGRACSCVTFIYHNFTVMVKRYGRIVIQSPLASTDASH